MGNRITLIVCVLYNTCDINRNEVISKLKASLNQKVRVSFNDGNTGLMTIINLDDEGFVNKIGEEYFWATFDDVSEIQAGPLIVKDHD